jgi:hypothetical protein
VSDTGLNQEMEEKKGNGFSQGIRHVLFYTL